MESEECKFVTLGCAVLEMRNFVLFVADKCPCIIVCQQS